MGMSELSSSDLYDWEAERDLFYGYRDVCLKNPNAMHAQSLGWLAELLLTPSSVVLGKPQPCTLYLHCCVLFGDMGT